jgi:hypothetical protein
LAYDNRLQRRVPMNNSDHRIYRTFEEFEREELRRLETAGSSVDEMIDTVFGQELDFEAPTRRRSSWDDDEE